MKIEVKIMRMPGFGDLGMTMAGNAAGAVLGMALQKGQDRRQREQAKKMQEMQIAGSKELTDYNAAKQLQMWKDTSYGAQKEQMMKAGINPALMYGMGGGGGQSNSVATGSVSSGGGPSTGGEIQSMMGMGMMSAAQIALLRAQKENIEADTKNKLTDAGYTGGAKTDNTKADTVLKGSQKDKTDLEAESQELDNKIKEYLQITDENGRQVDGIQGSVAAQGALTELRRQKAEAIFKEDDNARQAVMNNAQVGKIIAEVELLKKKGMTEMQILDNLKKDGTMKATEIEWQKIGLTKETLGQLLIGLLKKSVH